MLVDVGGSCARPGSAKKFNDHSIGGLAHMVKPMHGYETKDGEYLLFVDSSSCARRKVFEGGAIETIIGEFIISFIISFDSRSSIKKQW